MNPQPVQTPAQVTADSIHQMLEFKEMLQTSMTPESYRALITPYQHILEKVMSHRFILAIEACDLIMNQLDANLVLEEDDRELQKALYLLVACDMMGQDFINSLTQ